MPGRLIFALLAAARKVLLVTSAFILPMIWANSEVRGPGSLPAEPVVELARGGLVLLERRPVVLPRRQVEGREHGGDHVAVGHGLGAAAITFSSGCPADRTSDIAAELRERPHPRDVRRLGDDHHEAVGAAARRLRHLRTVVLRRRRQADVLDLLPRFLAALVMKGLKLSAPWMITPTIFLQPSFTARETGPRRTGAGCPSGTRRGCGTRSARARSRDRSTRSSPSAAPGRSRHR